MSEIITGAEKITQLYHAVNEVMLALGMHGEIISKDPRVTRVMNALEDIDGGCYSEISRLTTEHELECERLRAALCEAADCIEEWGAYVDTYYQQKYGLEDDIKRFRGIGAGMDGQ